MLISMKVMQVPMFLPTMDVPAKHRRDYRLIMAASVLYGLVDGLLYITMALYVNKESGSLPMVGFISSLPFLAVFVMSFVWGAVADKLGSYKWVMIFGNVVTGVLFFPMPYLDVYGLFGLRAVQVFFYSVNVLGVAVMTELLPESKGEGAAAVSLMTSVGWLVGGIVSGAIYYYVGMSLLFPLCGIMSFMMAGILLSFRGSVKAPAPMTAGKMFVFKNGRAIGLILAIIGLTYLANRCVFTVFPIYLEEWHDLTAVTIGLLSSTAGIVGAIVVVAIGKYVDRAGRRPMFIFAVFSYMFIWTVLLFTDNLFVVVILWAVPSWSFMTISATAMVSDLTSPSERGRGIGSLNSALNLGQFVGAGLSGLIAGWFNPSVPDALAVHEFKGIWLFTVIFLLIPMGLAFKVRETLKKRPKGESGPSRGDERAIEEE